MVLFINKDKKSFTNTMQTQLPTRRMQFRNITLQYDTRSDTQLRIRDASHVCGFVEGVRAKSCKLQAPSLDWFISYCSRFPFVSFYIAFFLKSSYYFRSTHVVSYYFHSLRICSLRFYFQKPVCPTSYFRFVLLASGHQPTMKFNQSARVSVPLVHHTWHSQTVFNKSRGTARILQLLIIDTPVRFTTLNHILFPLAN